MRDIKFQSIIKFTFITYPSTFCQTFGLFAVYMAFNAGFSTSDKYSMPQCETSYSDWHCADGKNSKHKRCESMEIVKPVLGPQWKNRLPCKDPHVDNTLVKHPVFVGVWRLRNLLCPVKIRRAKNILYYSKYNAQ